MHICLVSNVCNVSECAARPDGNRRSNPFSRLSGCCRYTLQGQKVGGFRANFKNDTLFTNGIIERGGTIYVSVRGSWDSLVDGGASQLRAFLHSVLHFLARLPVSLPVCQRARQRLDSHLLTDSAPFHPVFFAAAC